MRMIVLSVGLMCCVFYVGCSGSGRTPNPVLSYMPGDGAMSCEELRIEMAKVKQEIALKPTKIQERNARNRELASLWFLIYPLAEIDSLGAEEIELKALNTRYNHLFMIAAEKGCPLGASTITVRRPGGRELTVNDILEGDELPSHIDPSGMLRH